MSNLLEQASLVMIPSGYKEDIVYSVIPTSGAGDLTFTRASNGTRIDSNGNVEVVPWNLLQYSEDFSNAVWSASGGTTVTANSTTAPNGTTTADTIVLPNNAALAQDFTSPTSATYTFSIYLKASSNTTIKIGFFSPSTVTTCNVTTEWQRFEFSHTFSGTLYPQLFNNSGSSVTVFAWGAQTNIGSTAKPYFPTTDRLNVPRLTYQNGGGGCPSLLLEKQSTNTALYSEDFSNAFWVKEYVTISTNATTSPDGTQNADKIQEDTTNASHVVGNNDVFAGGGQAVTFSIFLKASERSWAALRLYNGSSSKFAWYNLASGVLGTVDSGVTASIENYGNGWYRCIMTITMSSVSITLPYVFVSTGNNVKDYTGTSGSGLFVWGAQHEASSYSTSYIPTTSTSATRVADACYKTGASSLIGQTEGVIFMDAKIIGAPTDGSFFGVQKSASNFVIRFGYNNLGFFAQVFNGSGNLFFETISYTLGTRIKIALAYKASNYAVYANGMQMATGTNATTIPACDEVMTNSLWGSVNPSLYEINEAILFPTRLTNSELAQLTGNQNYTINQAYESYGVASESPNCVQP